MANIGSWRIKPNGELVWSDETHRIFRIRKDTPMTYALFLGTVHRMRSGAGSGLDQSAARRTIRHRASDHRGRRRSNGCGKRRRAGDHSDQALASALGTAQDITDLKVTEEKLKLRTEELARSNAELEQFAYVASHDLQEPLRMVSNYLSLFGKEVSGESRPQGAGVSSLR